MGLFGGNKTPETTQKPATLNITSTPMLPGKDIIEYITKNDNIPRPIKERNWYKDYVQITTSQFTEDEAESFLRKLEIKEDIMRLNRKKVYFYKPGRNPKIDLEDRLYNLGVIASVRKATIGEGKNPIVQDALKSSTLVETRQGTQQTAGEKQQKKGIGGKIAGIFGI